MMWRADQYHLMRSTAVAVLLAALTLAVMGMNLPVLILAGTSLVLAVVLVASRLARKEARSQPTDEDRTDTSIEG
jgi:hypothetical protein